MKQEKKRGTNERRERARKRLVDDAHLKLQSNKSRRQKSNGHICVCETVGQFLSALWGPNVLTKIVKLEVIHMKSA